MTTTKIVANENDLNVTPEEHKAFMNANPNGLHRVRPTGNPVVFDEKNMIIKATSEAKDAKEKVAYADRPYHKDLETIIDRIKNSGATHAEQLDKYIRRVLDIAFQHKDPRVITEGLNALKVWDSKEVRACKVFCIMWGCIFASEDNSVTECEGIRDWKQKRALCELYRAEHYMKYVKAYRADKAKADKADKVKNGSPYAEALDGLSTIATRAEKEGKKIAGNPAKVDEIRFHRAEREFASELYQLGMNMQKVANEKGLDMHLLFNALASHMDEAINACKTARETK